MEEDNADFSSRIGQRVESNDGARGWVRYFGPVEGTTGNWLGVEWDKADRGKHDGTHRGRQYFEPQTSASEDTACSFLRAQKIKVSLTFMSGLIEKYVNMNADVSMVMNNFIYSTDFNKVDIELIGQNKTALKLSAIDALVEISLRDMQITTIDSTEQITNICLSLKEVDIADNLISDWAEVSRLTQALPNLRLLDVSGNMFLPSTLQAQPLGHNLRVMILNRITVKYGKVMELLSTATGLEELHMACNHITDSDLLLGPSAQELQSMVGKLKLLNLTENSVHSWGSLSQTFGQLPVLESLLVPQNPLESVEAPKEGEQTPFPALKFLSLAYTHLTDMSSVDNLQLLPSLRELRIRRCPVTDIMTPEKNRQELILRVQQLTSINGSAVNNDERRDVEVYWRNRLAQDYHEANKDEDKTKIALFNAVHPFYQRLILKYGVVESSKRKTLGRYGAGTVGSDLVAVKLKLCDDLPGDKPNQEMSLQTRKSGIHKEVELLPSMTVANVELLCKYSFNRGHEQAPFRSRLHLSSSAAAESEGETVVIHLDDPTKPLSYYSIMNNDVVMIFPQDGAPDDVRIRGRYDVRDSDEVTPELRALTGA
eukprot:Clim_evm11s241 gene=Clim_evmTU11s241